MFVISASLIALFVVCALLFHDSMEPFFTSLRGNLISSFESFFILTGNIFVFICLVLIVSPMGKVRIGGMESTPDFSYPAWFLMLFAAGMAAELAMAGTIYHWALHPWSIYALLALGLALFSFNKGLPLTLLSIFYPLLGERIWVWPEHIIDILAVMANGLWFSHIFGVWCIAGLYRFELFI